MTYTLENQERGTELLKILTEKSWESPAFRSQLVKNPQLTIQSVVGENFVVPESKKLVVEDQTDESVIYLNIPGRYDLNDIELSDEQLQVVAGGEVLLGTGIGIAVGIGLCWAVSHL